MISQCHRLSRYNNACTTSNHLLRIHFPFHSLIYVHCQPTITRRPIIDHSEGHPTVHPLLQHCCIGALYASSPIATALLHWCSLCTVTHCYNTAALVLSMHRHPLLQHCCIGALYAPSPIATALLHWCSLCTVTHCYSTGALVLSMHRHTQVHS